MNFRTAIPALIALFAPLAAEAAAPSLIPVTGYLTDANGLPIDGTVDIDFKIYRTATGPTPQWNNNNQGPMSVDVFDGQFTAYLGSDGALDLGLFRDNTGLYLGMAVDGGAEMLPRFEIGSAPFAGYAKYCDEAATVSGTDISQIRVIGDDILWSEIDATTLPAGLANGDDVGPTYTPGTGIGIAGNVISADKLLIEGWARGVAWDSAADATGELDLIYLRKQSCAANQVLMSNGSGLWTCTDSSALPLSEAVIDGFVANDLLAYATAASVTTLAGRVTANELDIGTLEGNVTTINGQIGTVNTSLTNLQGQVTGLAGNPGNMLAQYELDENAGATTFVDTSGLSNNLTGTLGALIAGSPGHSTRAVSFSGSQGLLAASGNKIADVAQVSSEMWIQTGNPNVTYTLLEKQGAYKLRMVAGKLEWTVTTVGGTCTITHPTPIGSNTWTNVSGSFDGLSAVVSINGAGQAVPCATGTLASTYGAAMTIGGKIAGASWSEVFNGNIDEVRIRPTTQSGQFANYGAQTFSLPGSILANVSQQAQVNTWVAQYAYQKPRSWTLCYRRTTHGAASSTFHTQCDGKGPTVTLMSLGTGRLIGGYNPSSWHTANEYNFHTGEDFLFSLTNGRTYPGGARQYMTYNNNSYGPTFGGGHDIYVNSGMQNGSCNFADSYYYAPAQYSYGLNQNAAAQELCGVNFGGNPVFSDIEVYYATY